jgi:hypothetical protein
MLTIRFDPLVTGEAFLTNPAPYFRIMEGELLAGPRNLLVASYHNGTWRVGDRYFTVFGTLSPTLVRFENLGEPGTTTHGPFERAQVIDGAIRDGTPSGGLLAHFDERLGRWYVYPDRANSPTVVLEPAGV